MRERPNFEKLEIYRMSEELADLVWDLVHAWRNLAKDTVGKQLIRAADSIGANIAEGHGRGTYHDNARFVDIASGSLNETTHWLRRASRRHLLKESQTKELRRLLDNLGPMLNAYRKTLKARARSSRAKPRTRSTIH